MLFKRRLSTAFRASLAPLAFLAMATAMLWPLPLHLSSALPGDPSGDTGVYVWNLWIFRHEFLDHARLPISTGHIFAYSGSADFSLHNYTPLAGMIGMPLMPMLGVVATYNVVLIVLVAASGWGAWVLARRIGLSPAGAFAAGALFIATPVITAREVAHLSLVSAAALPLFLWALLRVLDSRRRRDAVLVGVVVAFACYSDAYFGIYCILMGLITLGWRFTRVTSGGDAFEAPVVRHASSTLLAVSVVGTIATVSLLLAGVDRFTAAGQLVRVGLHGPVLLLTVAALLRAWLAYRPMIRLSDPHRELPSLLRLGAVAVAVCLVLMGPTLAGILGRYQSGRLPDTAVLWRSSPRGLDLLSYVVPNPLSPWFGAWTKPWFMPPQEDAFPEFVGAFSLVALAAIAWAWRREGLPRFWLWFTACFAGLSVGPFLHVAGIPTLIPGPWALLRYVPLLGMARAPSRFAIVAVLGGAMLFGYAIDILRRQRMWTALAILALMLALELDPVPRQLFPADVPAVYDLVASGDESRAVLELPTGVRDGTSSLGDFNARSQFFQTRHGHPLVGGYLSRVSEWRKREMLSNPTLKSLVGFSTPGWTPAPSDVERAQAGRDLFLARSCVGFVVLDRRRASPALREAAVAILKLESVHEDEQYELLRPQEPPPCRGAAGTGRRAGGPHAKPITMR